MKQRVRSMNGGDDLIGSTMVRNKHEEGHYDNDVQLHRFKPQEHFIEAQVQEGDTLQAIALRFYCSISELKRINQIHKENEIYARPTIKVPVNPYSVLTELIQTQDIPQPKPSTSKHDPGLTSNNLLHNPAQTNLRHETNRPDEGVKNHDCAIDCNTVILNSIVAPAVIPYTDSEVIEPVSEETKLLPEQTQVSVDAVIVKKVTSHGSEKWFHLVCIVLVLGALVSLVYITFYLDISEHSVVQKLPTNTSTIKMNANEFGDSVMQSKENTLHSMIKAIEPNVTETKIGDSVIHSKENALPS